uniref:uncharacterized protein LOC120342835 n=1 Tax=Styela clava TaxID=7725 RepID=UPI001939E0FC|nr:uncharacterized protein LOC120342835 [Styela clava]
MSVYDRQMIIISLTGERRTLHTCTQQEVGPHTVKRKRGSKVTPGRNLCRADQRGALRKSENMKSDNQAKPALLVDYGMIQMKVRKLRMNGSVAKAAAKHIGSTRTVAKTRLTHVEMITILDFASVSFNSSVYF